MNGLAIVVIGAAIAAGSFVRGILPADSQFTFVVISLGALVLLFGLAAYINACRDNESRPTWQRIGGGARPYRSPGPETTHRVVAAAQSARWSR